MRWIAIAVLSLAASAAGAQESRVVEACKAAAAHWFASPTVRISLAQDFAELSPPRARLALSAGNFECEFESRESPLVLQRLSFRSTTATPESTGEVGRRFEEVRYLLEQDGY